MLCRILDLVLQLSQFFDLRNKFIFFYQLVFLKLLKLRFVVSLLPQVVFWNYLSRIYTVIGFSTYCEWFESCGYVLFPQMSEDGYLVRSFNILANNASLTRWQIWTLILQESRKIDWFNRRSCLNVLALALLWSLFFLRRLENSSKLIDNSKDWFTLRSFFNVLALAILWSLFFSRRLENSSKLIL